MDASEDAASHQDVSDLDTARLALRGAVASLRNLQDMMTSLKSENQELVVREKAWKARVETMEQRLSEIHGRWQQDQTLLQGYKLELSSQLRREITAEEREKWQAQIKQLQTLMQEWQKAREIREAELARIKEMHEDRERDVKMLEEEKIAFERKAQSQMVAILERSRHTLQEALEVAQREKDQEIRELKTQWAKEVSELKEALRQTEAERATREDALQEDFRRKRQELEAIWRAREEDAWKQMEQARAQTESTLRAQYQARLGALEQERAELQSGHEQKLRDFEAARAEKEKSQETLSREKETVLRERYLTELQEKEGALEIRRLELEQLAARREAELLARFRREEEALRNSIKQLESGLRRSANEEMARRKAALKNADVPSQDPPGPAQ